jgi:predicted permease
MDPVRTLLEWMRRVWGTVGTQRRDADMEEELRLHAELARQRGLHSGGVAQAMDAMRDQRGLPWLEDLVGDLRYACRLLRRTPAFTSVAILSLAIGIGANAAIFNLLNAIVLRPLPVADPQGLVQLVYTFPTDQLENWNSYFGYPQLDRFRAESRTLSGIFGGTSVGRVNLAFAGQSGLAICDAYTANLFSVLGLRPELGRFFNDDEDRDDASVAVISDSYWRARFGADASIVGRSVTIDQLPFTVIGVAPAGFRSLLVGGSRDVWVPLHALSRIKPNPKRWSEPFTSWLTIVGRLQDGITKRRAESELDVIYRRLAAEQLAASDRQSSEFERKMVRESHLLLHGAATGVTSGLRHTYETPLKLLLVVAGITLLIACANVASLMLARASHRRHEFALRMALGSGRTRIVRQLLTESLLLAAGGGLAALAVAWWGGAELVRMVSTGDNPLPLDVRPDWRVFVFTAVVALVSGVLFGLAPAIRGTRVDPGPSVKASGRGSLGGPRRLDHVLVAAQVTLSIVLVSGAAMFTRSLQKLRSVDVGYDRANILMFSTDAGLGGYSKDRAAALYKLVLEKLSPLPGVQSATASVVRPVDDAFYLVDQVNSIDGRQLADRDHIKVAWNSVAPGYFSTLGIPLLIGRDFDSNRDACAFMCIVINESLARKAFPGQNPLGHRLSDAEIIGVVKDSRYNGIQDPPRPVIYRPLFQPTGVFNTAAWINGGVSFELRYRAESGLIEEARQAMASVDPGLPIFRIKTLQSQTNDSLLRERLLVVLSNGFGGLALVLACLGLYGLMAYAVARRTAEIGVRMALGASRRAIVRLVVSGSLGLVVSGAVVGVPLSVWTSRFARSLLFEVTPTEPVLIAVPVAMMFIIAGIACYVPARRAARVDPVVALRCE